MNPAGGGWHLRPGRHYLLAGATVVLAGILVAVAIDAIAEGKVAAAVLLLVVAVAFLVLGFPTSPRRDPRLVETSAGRALLLPVNPPGAGVTVGLVVLGVLLVLGGGIGASEGHWGGLGAILVGALLMLGGYASVRARLIPDRGVALLPAGVLLRTRREPVALAWEAITGLRTHWTRRVRGAMPSPDEMVHNWLTFEVAGSSHGVSMDPTTFAIDPVAALALLQHYLDHPDDRPELGTDRSLERARRVLRGADPG